MLTQQLLPYGSCQWVQIIALNLNLLLKFMTHIEPLNKAWRGEQKNFTCGVCLFLVYVGVIPGLFHLFSFFPTTDTDKNKWLRPLYHLFTSFLKMGNSRPLFLYTRLFIQLSNVNVNFDDDWIRTMGLWWKQLLYQLSHYQFPICLLLWVANLKKNIGVPVIAN